MLPDSNTCVITSVTKSSNSLDHNTLTALLVNCAICDLKQFLAIVYSQSRKALQIIKQNKNWRPYPYQQKSKHQH